LRDIIQIKALRQGLPKKPKQKHPLILVGNLK